MGRADDVGEFLLERIHMRPQRPDPVAGERLVNKLLLANTDVRRGQKNPRRRTRRLWSGITQGANLVFGS